MADIRRQILIVDDDDLSREVLAILLESEDFNVTSATSGDEALTYLSSGEKPSIILTDLQMPGMSGGELLRRMRATCGAKVRLVAMSGSDPGPEQVASFDGFLLKPFSPADLDRVLIGADGSQVVDTVALAALDEAVYASFGRVMTGAQVAELYALCFADSARRIDGMRSALRAGDDAAFRRQAHAIKGGCGMVGALELQQIAAGLEDGGIQGLPDRDTSEMLDQFGVAAERLQRMLRVRGVPS